jgi:hypothetical protein
MDMIDMAILLAARKFTTKSYIAAAAQDILAPERKPTHREMLKAIDGLVSKGHMRQKTLGVYVLEPEGQDVLIGVLPLLSKIENLIRFSR